jgi:hypothetical protein
VTLEHDVLPPIPQDQPRWPEIVPAGWIVLAVFANGPLILAQRALGVSMIPTQWLARIALAGLTLGAVLLRPRLTQRFLSPQMGVAVSAFGFSVFVSFCLATLRPASSPANLSSFVFMYGIGGLIFLTLLAPLPMKFGRIFRILFALSIALGIAQTARQDLILPDDILADFGIVFERFVDGRVRATSFFASPPRFAEFLTIGSVLILHRILFSATRRPLYLSIYFMTAWLLFNTYSRSGYILFLTSSLILIIMDRKWLRSGRGMGRRGTFAIFGSAMAVAGVAIADLFPVASPLTDTSSVEARQQHWSELLERFDSSTFLSFLFGTGQSARFSRLDTEYFVVDNLLFAIFLYAGSLGVLTFVFLSCTLIRESLRVPFDKDSPLRPLLAFFVGLLFESLFVDNHNTVFLTQLTLIGVLTQGAISHGLSSPSQASIGTPLR